MPRYDRDAALWEPFRRRLAGLLERLGDGGFVIAQVPDGAYVQFVNEGRDLLGECCDPRLFDDLAPRAAVLDERIHAVGWDPIDPHGGSPNYSVTWYPGAGTPVGAVDPDDARDAAALAVDTFRRVFDVADPRRLHLPDDGAGDDDAAPPAQVLPLRPR
ncbi:TY-Chap domain-containing protein [Geodermatophilus sp. SYSU D01045]